MKKFVAFISALSMVLAFTSCKNSEKDQTTVYSFSGKNESVSISNGTVVLTDYEEVFYGGNLNFVQPENISSYRATFYIMTDGQQETVFVDELSDVSPAELLNFDLGKKVGNNSEISKQFRNIEDADGKFWCELKVTDAQGNSNSYSVELELVKVS